MAVPVEQSRIRHVNRHRTASVRCRASPDPVRPGRGSACADSAAVGCGCCTSPAVSRPFRPSPPLRRLACRSREPSRRSAVRSRRARRDDDTLCPAGRILRALLPCRCTRPYVSTVQSPRTSVYQAF